MAVDIDGKSVTPGTYLRTRELVIYGLVALLLFGAGWVGRDRWDDRQLRRHCESVGLREIELEDGEFVVDTAEGPVTVRERLSVEDRERYLKSVRRELDRCAAIEVRD